MIKNINKSRVSACNASKLEGRDQVLVLRVRTLSTAHPSLSAVDRLKSGMNQLFNVRWRASSRIASFIGAAFLAPVASATKSRSVHGLLWRSMVEWQHLHGASRRVHLRLWPEQIPNARSHCPASPALVATSALSSCAKTSPVSLRAWWSAVLGFYL